MSDYSWIKPGAKAIITSSGKALKMEGEIVTISSHHEDFSGKDGDTWIGVWIEEGVYLAEKYSTVGNVVTPGLGCLKPFNPPNWNAIAEGKVANLPNPRIKRVEKC